MSPALDNSWNPTHDTTLRRLTRPQGVEWATLALLAACYAWVLSTSAAALAGIMPLWVAMLLNSIAAYASFSVYHDGLHRAITARGPWNDAVGNLAAFLIVPWASVPFGRWLHSQHHQNAGDPMDPDECLHKGPSWTLPLRLMNFDLLYTGYYRRHAPHMIARHWRSMAILISLTLTMIIVPTALGYGLEMLMLWLIPTRLGLLGIGFTWEPLIHSCAVAQE